MSLEEVKKMDPDTFTRWGAFFKMMQEHEDKKFLALLKR